MPWSVQKTALLQTLSDAQPQPSDPRSYAQVIHYDYLHGLPSAFGLYTHSRTWKMMDKLLMGKNYLWLYVFYSLWCNVSTHYNDDCSSYRRNVTQHLYIIQCINRTWIWIYRFIGLLYTIKFLNQKDLTCGMEHLLQKLGSPSKT